MLLYIGIVLFICSNFIGLEVELNQGVQYLSIFLLIASLVGMLLNRRILGIFSCCFFIFLGFFNGSRCSISAENLLSSYWGQAVVVQGSVDVSSVRLQENGCSFIIECEQVIADEMPIDYGYRLRVFADKKQINKFFPQVNSEKNHLALFGNYIDDKIPAGKIILSGTLENMSSFRNPGSFDSKSWNRVQEIGGRIKNVKFLMADSEASAFDQVVLLNSTLREYLRSRLSEASGPLLSGMLLGGGADLDEETRELFAQNGIAHLLSVSGAHLVLLASLLSLLLKPFPNAWRKILILMLLVGYGALCGFKPPVLRALCMSAVVLYGGSGGKRGLVLGLTAVVLLLYKPIWLLDLGFQLSFLAVAGIFWLQPKCQQLLGKVLPDFISELGAVTLAAQLAVLPFEIAYFHQISIISIISNLCLVPILELAALFTISGLALGVIPISEYFFLAASFLTEQIIVQARWLAELSFSIFVIGAMPLWCGAVYYILLIVWADVLVAMYLSNAQRRCVLIMCSTFLGIAVYMVSFGQQPMTAYFLDVGQGDCAVVVTPQSLTQRSKIIVFDTGGLKNYSTGSKILAPFLRTLGKKDIDMLVLSHYDFDHVGGAADLSRVCNAKQVILPKELVRENSEKLLHTLGNNWKSCGFSMAENGKTYTFNDVLVKLIDVPKEMSTGNETSTLAEVSYKNYKLLFTGDMGEERERLLTLQTPYDVLKAGHHGSRYSSSDYFLRQVQPKLTVISCGTDNRFGHPHQEALERFAFYGSKVLRTDLDGCIKLVFEDTGIKVYGYREGDWTRI